MDAAEYDLEFFHRSGFRRRACVKCGSAFWSLGEHEFCQEAPCAPSYTFLGQPAFSHPRSLAGMREEYLTFFEKRGHTRVRRYPTVARWRNDVFFTQASIYDFQPWVTSGAIPPPANPLVISQPCVRFIDLEEVGKSGRHLTLFEMLAHHAFNRPDHQVYFKDRCVELCHELLTGQLGCDPGSITYKEEEWEGGGNLGPSLSVGLRGTEVATLVFMEYLRVGNQLKPMPLTVVDTGYGLDRLTWVSQGTRTVYEAVFSATYDEVRRTFPATETAILIDHARAINFLLTDGVIPSNSKDGYFARLLLRRMIRILEKIPEAPGLVALIDRVGRDVARDYPEIGEHRDDLHRVVEAEMERYAESIERARGHVRRTEERLRREGKTVGPDELVEWYDSLGVPPDVAVAELAHPPAIPADFYARLAARHEQEERVTDYGESAGTGPEIPATTAETQVEYFLDPYTLSFEGHVLWSGGPHVVLDRTYFYPTGGGQVTDTGQLGEIPVVEVTRRGPWVVHTLDRPSPFLPAQRVRGTIDRPRRLQLMQHHTATHLLNGALRELLGPHVWQAGAYKGTDSARIDITHFKALSADEIRKTERRVNEVVRENRPVKSYFEPRNEAERRFGFTLYQGGAVPGKELRIIEIEGFDVEACGGTHCTHTSEVGLVSILGTERIQDGVVRLTYAAGDRALTLHSQHEEVLQSLAKRLAVPVEGVADGVERLFTQVEEARQALKAGARLDLEAVAARLEEDTGSTSLVGRTRVTVARLDLAREQLMDLSRRLTRAPDRVVILASEKEGRGIVFVGSSAVEVPAMKLLDAAKPAFQGKGGGNATAATAVGEPGEPLTRAIAAAKAAVPG